MVYSCSYVVLKETTRIVKIFSCSVVLPVQALLSNNDETDIDGFDYCYCINVLSL